MTEYELGDLINGVSSNLIAGQALFLTILSAYLAVAYTVGNTLTRYQVFFINAVFVLFGLVGLQSQLAQFGMTFYYSDSIMELRGTVGRFEVTKEAVRAVVALIRVMLIVGALVFMWQVRHPKTE